MGTEGDEREVHCSDKGKVVRNQWVALFCGTRPWRCRVLCCIVHSAWAI